MEIHFGWDLILIYIFLFVMVVGVVSLGLIFGSLIESPETFGLINSIVNFPMFFLSGALFPLKNLPAWLTFFTRINPVTYAVDAIRALMLGSASVFSLSLDIAVLIVFALVMLLVGTYTFRKMKI